MDELPDIFYGAAQVAELDRRMIQDHEVDGFELMQRAAQAAFATLCQRWPRVRSLLVFCGPGNNGGDGFLVAKLARAAGIDVRLLYFGDRARARGDAARALSAWEQAGGAIEDWTGSLPTDAEVLVDALLGTGLGRPLAGPIGEAVCAINAARASGSRVFAIDIPSGVDADRGCLWGDAVRADATATFIGAKLGLFTGEGSACAGEVSFHRLDAPPEVFRAAPSLARRISDQELRAALPRRSRNAHKGSHGHLLCIGGNSGMGGAARMAAQAALRVGAGLVSVATRAEHAAAMTQARPELMCRAVADAQDLTPLLASASVIAIGPGLGQDDWARALFAHALQTDLPLVVDADALNLLAAEACERGNWVLTPHPGEAGRLLGCDSRSVQADRPKAVAELSDRYRATAVLKGAGTLVQGADDGLWLCTEGNPGMATGGMGDLLTGVIAGLAAQGLPLEQAARVGVTLHARAADCAAAQGGERGLLPGDCLVPLRRLANPNGY
ncbi:MAG: NAD(P)H-hydrate dehydratase [Salinisphaera sp.]|nr:NAD(P)H-hydrate dehydratase [Salinisphaera sp.]